MLLKCPKLCLGKMSDGLMFNGDIRVAITAFEKNGAPALQRSVGVRPTSRGGYHDQILAVQKFDRCGGQKAAAIRWDGPPYRAPGTDEFFRQQKAKKNSDDECMQWKN